MVQDKAQKSRIAFSPIAVGVLAVSAAAIVIHLADTPALTVAFWRNALDVLVLLPIVFYRQEALPPGRALLVGLASEAALGPHFGCWISSLDHTSVAASVVLVCT